MCQYIYDCYLSEKGCYLLFDVIERLFPTEEEHILGMHVFLVRDK